MSLWLIGAGPMSLDYAKVLQSMGQKFEVIGRGRDSAKNFQNVTGQSVLTEGIDKYVNSIGAPGKAIVSVSIDQLAGAAIKLIMAGTKHILLEKPGAMSKQQLHQLQDVAVKYNANVVIGYNRRFYSSTMLAKQMIDEDGGATSCNFEFTEWSHTIQPMVLAAGIKDVWLLSNSSHVLDLAFHICGAPTEWKSFHHGSMDWHLSSARFCGAGITDKNILFSYIADWEAPGRWGVEIMTRRRRLIFRPMEQLHVMNLGSVNIEKIELNDDLDKKFKPGLYLQTQSFLAGDYSLFCSLDEQTNRFSDYYKIAGYK